jgi:hypothetical protein
MSARLKPFHIDMDDGTLEGLKWLALVLMVLDHVDKYFFHEQYQIVFFAGRICMPLFALILAYNLARPDSLESGRYSRILRKLALFGALAMPAYWLLGVPFFVLNIMFTLAIGVLCIWLINEGGALNKTIALLAFFILSALVEFWWFGAAVIIVSWYFFNKPSVVSAALVVAAIASLAIVNRNFYALLALPIFFGAQYVKVAVPRLRHVFYVIYPAHLTLILLTKIYVMPSIP